jgi:hypothetical protein
MHRSLFVVVFAALIAAGCSNGPGTTSPSPTFDAGSSASGGLHFGKKNIVWGTPSGSGEFVVGIDPSTVPAGNSATGKLENDSDFQVTYFLTYGPRCSGPASVVVQANSTASFTVSTSSGSGDAGIAASANHESSVLAGSAQGNNIVWGT